MLSHLLVKLKTWQTYTTIPMKFGVAMWIIGTAILVLVAIFTGACSPEEPTAAEAAVWYSGLSDTWVNIMKFDFTVFWAGGGIIFGVGVVSYFLVSLLYSGIKRNIKKSLGDNKQLLPLEQLPAAFAEIIHLMNHRRGFYDRDVITLLGELGNWNATPYLAQALKNGTVSVRKEAVGALWKLKDKRAIEPLTIALGDEDLSVRAGARAALSAIQNPTPKPIEAKQ